MRIRKTITGLTTAALIGAAGGQFAAIDTAYATAAPIVYPSPHALTPWPPIVVFAGVAGVMLNAAIVWNTQCRELTSQEAITSTFLPLIGIAFNAQASKCHR